MIGRSRHLQIEAGQDENENTKALHHLKIVFWYGEDGNREMISRAVMVEDEGKLKVERCTREETSNQSVSQSALVASS